MKTRIILLLLFFSGLWSLLILRATYLQILPNKKLSDLQNRQFLTRVKLPGRRGVIYDRNGHELAISLPSYSLFADPKLIQNPQGLARLIARELKVPVKNIYKKLKDDERRFVWVQRHLSSKQYDKIKNWNYRGLGFIEEPKRVYPNGTLLAGVLGFVGDDNRGLEGVEKWYQSELAGVDQEIVLRKDARGRPLMVDLKMFTEGRDGHDLQLTVDRDFQFELEKELLAAVETNRAESAVGVIMDVETSEVVAMANFPTFDANFPQSSPVENRRNRAVTDTFEPGSTMKTVLMAAALREDVLTPGKRYFCENGSYKVGKETIHEADSKHHFGWRTASEVLANSSNIGATKIAFELGPEKYRSALVEFGFGVKTGVDFPGEAKGIVNNLPWKPHLLSNVSFGHGIAATPLQVAAAYTAIANGGVWRTPRLVKSFKNKWGEEVGTPVKASERRLMPPEKAAQLLLMLNSVTGSSGPVANARIAGFLVAGKTGTAQKVRADGAGYVPGAYISSFAGLVPAHQPKFVIYVAVDNPKKAYYGSQVAAPIFSNLAAFAVRREGMSPVLVSESNFIPQVTGNEKVETPMVKSEALSSAMPDWRGLTLREVQQHLQARKIRAEVHGSGVVVRTIPLPGLPLAEGQDVDVFLSLVQ